MIQSKLQVIPNFGKYLFLLGILVALGMFVTNVRSFVHHREKVNIVCGSIAVSKVITPDYWYMGIYCIVIGVFLAIFEIPFSCYRSIPLIRTIWTNYLIRGGVYFISAIPCYLVGIGILGGILFSLLSLLYVFVGIKGESAEEPEDTLGYSQMIDAYKKLKGEESESEDSEDDDD